MVEDEVVEAVDAVVGVAEEGVMDVEVGAAFFRLVISVWMAARSAAMVES